MGRARSRPPLPFHGLEQPAELPERLLGVPSGGRLIIMIVDAPGKTAHRAFRAGHGDNKSLRELIRRFSGTHRHTGLLCQPMPG